MKGNLTNTKKASFILLALIVVVASLTFCQPTVASASHSDMGYPMAANQHKVSECCKFNAELSTATNSKLNFFIGLIVLILAFWQVVSDNPKIDRIRFYFKDLINNRGPNLFNLFIKLFSQGILHSKNW